MLVKMPLVELTDVDVEFLSLVKRGANQLPFRIVKSGAPAMRILGIVAKKDILIPTKLVDSKKYDILDESVFLKDDVSAIDKGSFLLAVEGVQKGLTPYNPSLSFSDAASAYNIYPTIMSALGLVSEYLAQSLYDVGDKTETIQSIDATLASMHAYVIDLLNMLPEEAYDIYRDEDAPMEQATPMDANMEHVVMLEGSKDKPQLDTVDKIDILPEKDTVDEINNSLVESILPTFSDFKSLLESFKGDLLAIKGKIDTNTLELTALKDSIGYVKSEVEVMKGAVLIPAQGEKTKDTQNMPVVKRSKWSGTALDIFDKL